MLDVKILHFNLPYAEKIEIPTALSFLLTAFTVEPQLWLCCLDGTFFICSQGLTS